MVVFWHCTYFKIDFPPHYVILVSVMAFIYIQKLDGTANKYRLPNTEATVVDIGSSEDCMISLPDIVGVSGVHCSIVYHEGYYWIKDEGSSNGTIHNESPITQEVLVEGEFYYLGEGVLSFVSELAPPAPAPQEAAPAQAAATPQLKKSAVAPAFAQGKGRKPTYSKAGLALPYVIIILVLAFVAGITLRHWKDTGKFYPEDLFENGAKKQTWVQPASPDVASLNPKPSPLNPKPKPLNPKTAQEIA